MKWFVWMAGWTLALVGAPLGIIFTVMAILIEGGATEPWGELAGLSFGTMAVGPLISLFLWLANEEEVPDRPVRLPRAERRELKKERARILLERRIEELELEVRR